MILLHISCIYSWLPEPLEERLADPRSAAMRGSCCVWPFPIGPFLSQQRNAKRPRSCVSSLPVAGISKWKRSVWTRLLWSPNTLRSSLDTLWSWRKTVAFIFYLHMVSEFLLEWVSWPPVEPGGEGLAINNCCQFTLAWMHCFTEESWEAILFQNHTGLKRRTLTVWKQTHIAL